MASKFMPAQKYFHPINISVQIGGYVSTYLPDEEFPYPATLLNEAELTQVKTLWNVFISASPVKILQQIILRPLTETIRHLDGGRDSGAVAHIISPKLADDKFAAKLEESVREFLNRELPGAVAEVVQITFLGAILSACKQHGIRCGDAKKLKAFLKGKGDWPKPVMSEELEEAFERINSGMFKRPESLIDKLIKTKRGLEVGAKKTRKAFRDKKTRSNSREEFFAKLYKTIKGSDEDRPRRKDVAKTFGISATTLDRMRKHFGDYRSWEQVIEEARKEEDK